MGKSVVGWLRLAAFVSLCAACAPGLAADAALRVGVADGLGAEQVATVYSMNAPRGYIEIKTVDGQKARTARGATLMPGAYELGLYIWEYDDRQTLGGSRSIEQTMRIEVVAGHSYVLQRVDEGGGAAAPRIKLYDLGEKRSCDYQRGILHCEGKMLLLYD